MTFVGKIFTVLIFVMSLVFMTIAMMVYATHKNWKEEVTRTGPNPGYKARLEAADATNKQLRDQKTALEEQLQTEQDAKLQVVAKQNEERKAWERDLAELQTQRDDLAKKEVESRTKLVKAHENLERLVGEVGKLRADIRDTQADRDTQFAAVVDLTDRLHQEQGEKVRKAEDNRQLVARLAKHEQAMRRLGLSPEEVLSEPPMLRGRVLAVNNDEKIIEVSLGSDDGLHAGHTLEVYRENKWLARVQVLRTDVDRATAKFVPGFKSGPVQEGDHVATRFKNDLAQRPQSR